MPKCLFLYVKFQVEFLMVSGIVSFSKKVFLLRNYSKIYIEMSTKICQALFKALWSVQIEGNVMPLGAYNSHGGDVQLKANESLVLLS